MKRGRTLLLFGSVFLSCTGESLPVGGLCPDVNGYYRYTCLDLPPEEMVDDRAYSLQVRLRSRDEDLCALCPETDIGCWSAMLQIGVLAARCSSSIHQEDGRFLGSSLWVTVAWDEIPRVCSKPSAILRELFIAFYASCGHSAFPR